MSKKQPLNESRSATMASERNEKKETKTERKVNELGQESQCPSERRAQRTKRKGKYNVNLNEQARARARRIIIVLIAT